MDALVESCQARGLKTILERTFPRRRNAMVAGLYGELGFVKTSEDETGKRHGDSTFPFPTHHRIDSSGGRSERYAGSGTRHFQGCLDDPGIVLTRESNVSTIHGWDSMTHVN